MNSIDFDFKDYNSLTMWDEQVSAFWDTNKKHKAIYQDDGLSMPYFKNGIQIHNQYLDYQLKNPISIVGDFEIMFKVQVNSLESFTLCKIGESGFISFESTKVSFSFGPEKTVTIKFPKRQYENDVLEIKIGRKRDEYIVYMASSTFGETFKTKFTSLEHKKFSITSIFGGMMALSGSLVGMSIKDQWTRLIEPEDTPQEVDMEEVITSIPIENNVDEEIGGVELDESDESVYFNKEELNNTTHIMTPFNKTLLDAEIALLSSYEGLVKALEKTKLAGNFSKERLERFVNQDRNYLVRFIYYALTGLEEYRGKDHAFYFQRAKFLLPYFMQSDTSPEESSLIYGFKDDKEYNSFLFGRISNATLTNEMVLTLVMEESEIWMPLFVKL